ncbi:MAG: hypothetical protein OK452_01415 [Thaumarchaeota archaeon]|nr:hypothetical protein [Nitrososphaerota archaeon]
MTQATKPKRLNGERVLIWLYHYWKHRSEDTRDSIKGLWYTFWALLLLVAFLYGLSYAIAYNLVQVPTVLSFGLVELFAFLLARYFLRGKRQARSVMELMAVIDNLPKYSHLIVHYIDLGIREGYPNRPEYVLNTLWNWAFWVPRYVRELAKVGAIQRVEHDTEDEMYLFFKTKNIHLENRYPQAYEMSSISRPSIAPASSPLP